MDTDQTPSAAEKQTMFERARELCAQRRYYQAAELLRALDQYPVGPAQQDFAAVVQSYLGLAVARSVGDYGEGERLAQAGLASKGYHADACHNLALIHLDRRDRQKAVALIWRGLKANPRHHGLLLLVKSLGVRRQPPLAFLGRSHPFNVWLGRLRNRLFPQRVPLPSGDSDSLFFE
jgi:tetratricopeptide (TPR) repeat protein